MVRALAMRPDPRPGPLPFLPQPGEVVAEKYRVERVLGGGGMGVVMEARHLALDERVAIKFLLPQLGEDPHALERFEREARAVFQLQSEHVVRVMDVGRLPAGGPYIVMEYLDGEDLAHRLHSGDELSIAEAVGIVLEASEALAEAHSQGVVHRDLKPENLFLTRKPNGKRCVKVVDFGLSKMAPVDGVRGPRQRSITGFRQPVGTPNYMAPELWLSARDAGPPADQWALGAILYELVAGAPAFGGDHMVKVCSRILEQEAAPLGRWREDVPAGLEQAVLRALEKDPARRFPSLYELACAIAPFGPPHAVASVERIGRCLQREASAPEPAPVSEHKRVALPLPKTPPPKARPASAPAPASVPSAPGSQPETLPDPRDLPPASATSSPSALPSGPRSAPASESAVPTTRTWQAVIDEAPRRSGRKLALVVAFVLVLALLLAGAAWVLV
jgi:serine/threonine-protein kinase